MAASISIFAGEFQSDRLPLIFFLSLSVLAAGFAIREYRRLKVAGLIIENQILHIQPAVIVSCFGILLDTRIIKFNQAGIRLLTVEIGTDSISIRYGTEKKVHMITLLCNTLNSDELADICRKFRYETGIMPTLIH